MNYYLPFGIITCSKYYLFCTIRFFQCLRMIMKNLLQIMCFSSLVSIGLLCANHHNFECITPVILHLTSGWWVDHPGNGKVTVLGTVVPSWGWWLTILGMVCDYHLDTGLSALGALAHRRTGHAAPPAQSKLAARGSQNSQWGLERCQPLLFFIYNFQPVSKFWKTLSHCESS